ncbi:rhodanese-like domain-containing protein [Jiulongibacter sp. NS-SX5]|uniref:rhodanese-like domain-containing protein n=1 Tax=Jiulongibacter sp. NS-SX5 TaxID=3463854 RepID=UPI004059FB1B
MNKTFFRQCFLVLCLWASHLQAQSISGLSADLFQNALRSNPDAVILDVRSGQEFERAHIKGARQIDFDSKSFLDEVLGLHLKTEQLYLYDFTGEKAKNAAVYLKDLGYQHVFYLNGGLAEWTASSKPYISSESTVSPIAAYTLADLDLIFKRNRNVVLFLTAPWCKYCKIMRPRLLRSTGSKQQIKLIEIDGSRDLAIAEHFQLTETPTILYFQNGKQVWKSSGEISEIKLQEALNR